MAITLDAARTIIAAGRKLAAEREFNPVTFVVLDAGGYLLAAEREDRSPNKQYEIAHGKAHGAVSVGIGSRGLIAHAKNDPAFFGGLAAALGSPLIASPGGVLVCDVHGTIVGAVGVSGESGDNDELLASHGIAAAGFVARCD